jgi:O-methyltransferase
LNAFRSDEQRMKWLASAYERATLPLTVFFLFSNHRFHPAYKLTWRKKMTLGLRIYRNWRRLPTGISYKGHLAIAAKLFEIPPSVPGVVVECGSWLGGTTANLSIICDVVGRELIVYDSFEGLPEPSPVDRMPVAVKGGFRGDLEAVRENVRRNGVIERCTFRKGWFKDTLPSHTEPICVCLIDVDLKASMHDCLVNLWPRLTHHGYVFFDEYVLLPLCALFFSERFWRDYLGTTPPGLMGAGTGVGVGQYYLGPWLSSPIQRSTSLAYTRRDYDALWDYWPE